MLSGENISYAIGHKQLLEEVSVAFPPGKLNLIIGPNGAGKSTLINVLCNQLRPQQGAVFYDQKNSAQISVGELARKRAVLSQNIELAFPLTVAEVVMMGRYPHFSGQPTDKDNAAVEAAMHFFDVWDMADRNYMTLSGGEKQRTHFARVVTQIWYPIPDSCRYLVLDEPLTFLDVYYQFDFMHKIKELLQQPDLVVAGVVHDLNLAAKFADQLVLLHQGRILSSGDKETVLTAENIKTAYSMEPVIRKEQGELHLFF